MVKKLYIHWMLPTIIMVLLLLTIATNNCFADEELRTYGHFRYVVNNNEITIKDYGYDYLSNPYEDELLTIRIPSVIDGIHVTRVSKEIFFPLNQEGVAYKIKNIICSDYMSNVCLDDFESLATLTLDSITLGKYTKTVDNYNMDQEGNNLMIKKIIVPKDAVYIKGAKNGAVYSKNGEILYAVPNMKKGRLTVSSKTRTIYKHAFYDSSLDTVKLPESIIKLYRSSFKYYAVFGKGVVKVPKKKKKWYRKYFSKSRYTKYVKVRGY